MINIQRDFLWGKGEEKNKQTLVTWEKICKPKSHGHLCLDDPEVLNKVLGEKLWWRQLKDSAFPQAQIWKQRYVNNWQDRDHIRMPGIIKGSHILNKAWQNRAIVQKQSFWEIRDGSFVSFWEDNWQQEPKILRENFDNLKKDTDDKGLHQVNDFLEQDRNE